MFVLKNDPGWEFALEEDPGKVYTLPPLSKLDYQEAEMMRQIGKEDNLEKQGKAIKEFVLKHVPELQSKEIGDMGYAAIFNEYALSQGRDKLGESSASQNS
jgi:hypothetical protein